MNNKLIFSINTIISLKILQKLAIECIMRFGRLNKKYASYASIAITSIKSES